ncbi:MAG: hypothetical protein ABW072_17080, partial [Sedimenticola sp.]
RIRELSGGKEVKIAALTASVFKEQREEVIEAGCDDFVSKPYRSEEIFDCMARHLDLRYKYKEEAVESADNIQGTGVAITPQRVLALSPELRGALENALAVLDLEEIRQVLEKITLQDPDLAADLSSLIEEFEISRVKRLLGTTDD